MCGEGDLAAIPLGAWHLTLVLSGPAAVFNLYTGLQGVSQRRTSRLSACCEQGNGCGEPVEITAVRDGEGFAVTGSPSALSSWGTSTRVPRMQGGRSRRPCPARFPGFYAATRPAGLEQLRCVSACSRSCRPPRRPAAGRRTRDYGG